MKLFGCKHEWAILSETTIKSKFEIAIGCVSGSTERLRIPHQMCDTTRRLVQVLHCKKCGKLHKFVTTN